MKTKILVRGLVCLLLIICTITVHKRMDGAELSNGDVIVPVYYLGGLDNLKKKKNGDLIITNSAIRFVSKKGIAHFNFPISLISGVYAGDYEIKRHFGRNLDRIILGNLSLGRGLTKVIAIEFTEEEKNIVANPIFLIKKGGEDGPALKKYIEAKIHWETIVTAETIPEYEEFLNLHPDSEYVEEARSRMDLLKRESPKQHWLALKNTIPAYEEFLNLHPDSEYVEEARSRVDLLIKKEKPLTKKEQIEAFRAAKTARISVEQSYRYERGVKLPYEDLASTIFKNYANLTLVGSDATDYDLNIKITASGRAVGSNYGMGPGLLYTGASVYGTISLEISGIPVYEKKFSGSISPPKKLKISYAKEQPNPKELVLDVPFEYPIQAPFKPALESGTYVSRMIEMVGEIWDPNCVQAALQDESWVVRKSAVEALIKIKDPRVLRAETNEVLALIDKISDIKAKAAEKPAEVKDPLVAELLIDALKDEEPRVRVKTVEVLGKIRDPRSVELLVTTLKDEELEVRVKTVEVLGEINDPSAVEPLIAALQDEEPDVRVKVAGALGSIKDPRAVDPLIACLKDEYWSVRKSAIDALSRIKDPRAVEPLIATLKYEETEAPGELTKPRGPLELRTLKERKSELRVKAAYALSTFKDSRAIEALIATLKDDSVTVRIDVVKALGRIEDPSVVEPLIAALIDESWPVRGSAIDALSRTKDPRAVEPLVARLRDKRSGIQERAAGALGRFKDPRAVDALIAALQNKSKVDVAAKAADALGRIKDPRAVEPLIAALKRKKGFIAHNSADALGEIKDPRAIEPLIAALKNIWTKKNVQEALWKITGRGRFYGGDRKKWKKWWKQNKTKYIKNK